MDALHSRSWIMKITVMSVILGMLIAVSLKTQTNIRRNYGVAGLRFDELAGLYQAKSRDNERLRTEKATLEKKNADILNRMSSSSSLTGVMNRELQDAKFLAGLTEVEGSGLIVSLMDSQKKVPDNDPLGAIGYIIHEADIRDVVNELRAAGAEAVSVNKQRQISTSAIRCAGPVILVNDVDIAAPYEIKAIGDPKTLEGALRMPGGVVARMPDPKMITIVEQQVMRIEPYSGTRHFQYAHSVSASE
jgi:uncharacterized protein YlxW (UPF0749 family)